MTIHMEGHGKAGTPVFFCPDFILGKSCCTDVPWGCPRNRRRRIHNTTCHPLPSHTLHPPIPSATLLSPSGSSQLLRPSRQRCRCRRRRQFAPPPRPASLRLDSLSVAAEPCLACPLFYTETRADQNSRKSSPHPHFYSFSLRLLSSLDSRTTIHPLHHPTP